MSFVPVKGLEQQGLTQVRHWSQRVVATQSFGLMPGLRGNTSSRGVDCRSSTASLVGRVQHPHGKSFVWGRAYVAEALTFQPFRVANSSCRGEARRCVPPGIPL